MRWPLCIGLIVLALGGCAAQGFRNARSLPVVRRAAVALPDWPAGAPGLKVALVSDIHVGNAVMDGDQLRRVVVEINRAKPDLVLLAGDFVVGRRGPPLAKELADLTGPLGGLRAPLGTVAVLGNHDYWTDPHKVRAALEAAQIVVLENSAVRKGPITVMGVSDAFSGHDNTAAALDAVSPHAPIVTLTHSPDIAPRLPVSVHLLLAGHTHCGQMVLPVIGPLSTRSPSEGWRPLYNARYRCGLIHDPGRLVIVTGGVGSGTAPLRFGAPPDIWLVSLSGEKPSRPSGRWR